MAWSWTSGRRKCTFLVRTANSIYQNVPELITAVKACESWKMQTIVTHLVVGGWRRYGDLTGNARHELLVALEEKKRRREHIPGAPLL